MIDGALDGVERITYFAALNLAGANVSAAGIGIAYIARHFYHTAGCALARRHCPRIQEVTNVGC